MGQSGGSGSSTKYYTISVYANPSNGGRASGGGSYQYGDSAYLSATAYSGYYFDKWGTGGTTPSISVRVTANASYTAFFKKYISLILSVVGGIATVRASNYNSVSGTTYTLKQGVSTVLTISNIDSNYQFVGWSSTSSGTTIISTSTSYTYTTTTATTQYMYAILKPKPREYGKLMRLTATPATNYQFRDWYENGSLYSTDNPLNVYVNSDREFTANFELKKYVYNVPASTGGSVTGNGTYTHGTSVTLRAVPDAHYNFSGWKYRKTGSGQIDYITSNPITMTAGIVWTSNYNNQLAPLEAVFVAKTHTLTFTSNKTNVATLTGAGSYYYGSTANINVTVTNNSYEFVHWEDVSGNVISERPDIQLLIEANTTLKAVFALKKFTVECVAVSEEMGTVSGGGNYTIEDTVTLTAVANQHYNFVAWKKHSNVSAEEEVVSTSATCTTTITGDTTFKAYFTPEVYTITYDVTPANAGNVNYTGTSFAYGSTCSVTPAPGNDYRFIEWLYNNESASSNPNYSFTVSENATITAVYGIKNYTISFVYDELSKQSGMIPTFNREVVETENGYDCTLVYGDTVTVTCPSVHGYDFAGYYVNGLCKANTMTASFTALNDSTVTMVSTLSIYTVSTFIMPVDTPNTVTGDGNYAYGTNVTMTATPDSIYQFVNWKDNDGHILSENAIYTFTIEDNTDLTATFKRRDCTVTLSTNPVEGGTVTGSGTYEYGATATINAACDAAYNFLYWKNGDTTISNSQTYEFIVTENVSYTAYFTLKTGDIVIHDDPDKGGEVSGGGSYEYGDTVTVSVVPNNKWKFIGWYDNGVLASEERNYTFTFTEGRNLIAKYLPMKCEVKCQMFGGGIAKGCGIYDAGENVTIELIANEGYYMSSWFVKGGSYEGHTNTIEIANINDDITIVVMFVEVRGDVWGAVNEGDYTEYVSILKQNDAKYIIINPTRTETMIQIFFNEDYENYPVIGNIENKTKK